MPCLHWTQWCSSHSVALILIPVRVGIPSTLGTPRRCSSSSCLPAHPYLVQRGTRVLAGPSTFLARHADPLSGTQKSCMVLRQSNRPQGDQHPVTPGPGQARCCAEKGAADGGTIASAGPKRAKSRRNSLSCDNIRGYDGERLCFTDCKLHGSECGIRTICLEPRQKRRNVRVPLGCRKLSNRAKPSRRLKLRLWSHCFTWVACAHARARVTRMQFPGPKPRCKMHAQIRLAWGLLVRACACARACVRACVCARLRVCVRVCVRARVPGQVVRPPRRSCKS